MLRFVPSEFSGLTFFSPSLFSGLSFTLSQKLLAGNPQHLFFFSGPDGFLPFASSVASSAAKTASSRNCYSALDTTCKQPAINPPVQHQQRPPFPPSLIPGTTVFHRLRPPDEHHRNQPIPGAQIRRGETRQDLKIPDVSIRWLPRALSCSHLTA